MCGQTPISLSWLHASPKGETVSSPAAPRHRLSAASRGLGLFFGPAQAGRTEKPRPTALIPPRFDSQARPLCPIHLHRKKKPSSLPSLGSSAGGFILVSVLLSLLAAGLLEPAVFLPPLQVQESAISARSRGEALKFTPRSQEQHMLKARAAGEGGKSEHYDAP